MGCSELNITDYFRLTATTCKPDTPIPASTCTRKTASSRFFPVVSVLIPNYRYYSPEFGRWLSRDPINQMGSPAWWMGNEDRVELYASFNRINDTLTTLYGLNFRYSDIKDFINSLKKRYLFLQYEIQMDLLGKRKNGNNDNPYNFASNNPIDNFDDLGLKTSRCQALWVKLWNLISGGFTDFSRPHCYAACISGPGGSYLTFLLANIYEACHHADDWQKDLINNVLGLICAQYSLFPGNYFWCKCCCKYGPQGT